MNILIGLIVLVVVLLAIDLATAPKYPERAAAPKLKESRRAA
jgi:hypothetical protein